MKIERTKNTIRNIVFGFGQFVKKHVYFRIVYFNMPFKSIKQREKHVRFKFLCFNMYFTKRLSKIKHVRCWNCDFNMLAQKMTSQISMFNFEISISTCFTQEMTSQINMFNIKNLFLTWFTQISIYSTQHIEDFNLQYSDKNLSIIAGLFSCTIPISPL